MRIQPTLQGWIGAGCRTTRHSAGFTIRDLLGVLVGVGVLIGPSLSWFGRAGNQNAIVVCLANHRSLSEAWNLYAGDHGGSTVNNLTSDEMYATIAARTYQTWANNLTDWSTDPSNTNRIWAAAGQLSPYLSNSVSVFKCPSDTYLSAKQVQAGWSLRLRSYSMNAFMGLSMLNQDPAVTTGENSFFPFRQFLQLDSIPDAANRFVFLDEHPDSINDGLFVANPSPTPNPEWIDVPASYHAGTNGACGFSFADGHAEMHPWGSPSTHIPVRYYFVAPILTPRETIDNNWVTSRMTTSLSTIVMTRVATNHMKITWASGLSGYQLQQSPSVSHGPWTTVEGITTQSAGEAARMVPVSSGSSFFRLWHP